MSRRGDLHRFTEENERDRRDRFWDQKKPKDDEVLGGMGSPSVSGKGAPFIRESVWWQLSNNIGNVQHLESSQS